ncbi:hypothetical protein ACHAXS_005626 [Conticribra weissflogii]
MVGSSGLRSHLPSLSIPRRHRQPTSSNTDHLPQDPPSETTTRATPSTSTAAVGTHAAGEFGSSTSSSHPPGHTNGTMTETTPPGAGNDGVHARPPSGGHGHVGGGNLSLSRPYNIAGRVSTDDTHMLRVPSITRNSGGGMMIHGDDVDVVGGGGPATPPASAHVASPAAYANSNASATGGAAGAGGHPSKVGGGNATVLPVHCLNPASEINARLDTQVEVRVYPCNNNSQVGNKKKFTQFNVKPEGVIIQGTNRHRAANNDLGSEYAMHIGRKLQRYELSDTRACQLLVTTHNKSFWVVPAPEAFSRHSGTCRLLGDRKHQPASHTLQVGDFLRVGSVGVVVIETHDGTENRILSEEKIQKIMKDTTSNAGGFLDLAETDGGESWKGNVLVVMLSMRNEGAEAVCRLCKFDCRYCCHASRLFTCGGGVCMYRRSCFCQNTVSHLEPPSSRLLHHAYSITLTLSSSTENSDDSSQEDKSSRAAGDAPVCYMCFDEEDTDENPMITPCKCLGDTRYVHVNCLRKWHTAEADNQICFLSSVDATCSVCKSTFRSDFKLKDGRVVKLFKSSLEPPYVSLLVATKHEMAQRLFNTRFQLSFSTLLKPDGKNGTRPLLLGRSSGSDMVLDYRTVSARHATIRLKNGEFVFTDAGSSNGSYLYLRRPVELTPSQSVQFRLGRSMISMKVVNKWNRRLLRAVSRRVGGGNNGGDSGAGDDFSVGSNDDDVRITDINGSVTRTLPRRTREHIMESMPPLGTLSQSSSQHLDLLYALAYPKRVPPEKDLVKRIKATATPALVPPPMEHVSEGEDDEGKYEDESDEVQIVHHSPLEEVTDNLHEMNINDADEESFNEEILNNAEEEVDGEGDDAVDYEDDTNNWEVLSNQELKETEDNNRPGTPNGDMGETEIHEETLVDGSRQGA